MNFIRRALITFIISLSSLYAVGEPLIVGVENYDPPFIMQGSNKEIYGFDVDMMNSLCKIIERTCQFRLMRFDELLPAVASKTVDVGVSSITITAERSKIVDFSIPYLLGYSRFLTLKTTVSQQTLTLEQLNGKRIAIGVGTIFEDQVKVMGIKNPILVAYDRVEDELEALSNGDVDYIILDNPTALYWEANSAGRFLAAGKPYMFGFGLGIAINPSEKNLLNALNKALVQYQNSNDYQLNYDRYLIHF